MSYRKITLYTLTHPFFSNEEAGSEKVRKPEKI